MRINLVFFLLICLSSRAQLTDNQTKRLDELLNGFQGRNAAASVNVILNGKTVYSLNAGYANLEKNIRVSDSTLFNLASCSKQFTGLAVWELLRENKVAGDNPITDYLVLPDAYSYVHVKHLLTHTHGVREFHTIRQLLGKKVHKPYTEKEIWKYFNSFNQLSFAPGTKHLYSNSGFFLLHELVSKVDHNVYARLVNKAGLKETQWQNKKVKNKAIGYRYDTRFHRTGSTEQIFGYSNLLMSPRDLRNWMIFVLKSGFIEEVQQGTTLADGQKLHYFGGLFRKKYDSRFVFDHGGVIDGFRSFTRYIPELNCAIGIVLNTDVVDPEPYIDKITDVLFGHPEPRFETLLGVVRDPNDQPVPFAELYLDSTRGPVLTDVNGAFVLRSSEFLNYIVVKTPGANTRTVDLEGNKSPVDITLNQGYTANSKLKIDVLPEKAPDIFAVSPWVALPGAVMARKFLYQSKYGELQRIKFYIPAKGQPHKPFRIRIFEVDPVSGFPGKDITPESVLAQAKKGNEWVSIDLSDLHLNLTPGSFYYFGMEWIVAPGSGGMKSQFIGFYPYSTGSSVYRVPTDVWRRCGELMYSGNQELAIEIEYERTAQENVREPDNFYLLDTMYHSIMPATFNGPFLFLQSYPATREIRFSETHNNYWTRDDENWFFYSKFDDSGKQVVVEKREQFPNHYYRLVNTSEEEPIHLRGKRLVKNSGLTWRIRQKETEMGYELNVYLRPFRKMVFKHYRDNIYYLEGDLGFNRLLWLEQDERGYLSIEYADSRTLGIRLEEKR